MLMEHLTLIRNSQRIWFGINTFLFAAIWLLSRRESVVNECNLIVQRCANATIMQHGNGVHSGKQDGVAVHKISTDTVITIDSPWLEQTSSIIHHVQEND